jgi:hypothetical protein
MRRARENAILSARQDLGAVQIVMTRSFVRALSFALENAGGGIVATIVEAATIRRPQYVT